jgi:hypothetical protein
VQEKKTQVFLCDNIQDGFSMNKEKSSKKIVSGPLQQKTTVSFLPTWKFFSIDSLVLFSVPNATTMF